jgi:hypothetical protein
MTGTDIGVQLMRRWLLASARFLQPVSAAAKLSFHRRIEPG